jgi:hypothetical protein
LTCLNRKGFILDIITILRLKEVLRLFHADIVHTHRDKGNLHGRIAAILSPGTAIVTIHHDLGDIALSRNQALVGLKQYFKSISGRQNSSWVNSFIYPLLNIALNRFNTRVIAVSNTVRDIYTSEPENPRFVTVYTQQFFSSRIFVEKMSRMYQEIVVQHKTKNLLPH